MPTLRERGAAQLAVALPLSLLLVASCNLNPFDLGGSSRDGGSGDGGPDYDASGPIADAGPDAVPPDARIDACPIADEICDGIDNDCDTEIDEDFDLTSDPANCGSCGHACTKPNAPGTCESSVCQYECLPGFVDLDGDLNMDPSNGCEYLCIPTNGGVEACDFTDNDCDGLIDEDFDLATDVDNCGGCGKPCLVLHATPECVDGVCGFTACDTGYADVIPGVPGCEYACPEFPPAADESCDGVDNDCDGVTDELPIIGLGDPCVPAGFEAYGDKGECAFGVNACTFGTPFCSGYVGPTGEICDQLDNDCDDLIDEDFDKMNDPRNCGPTCETCAFPNAIAGCTAGVCGIVACNPGWVDDPDIAGPDCLYNCTPTGIEVCDGVDNDCDRLVDTDDPDIALTTPPLAFCVQNSGCAGTTPTCGPSPCDTAITWRCLYTGIGEADSCGALPVEEQLCDGVDGDCDGQIDEPFPAKNSPCSEDGSWGTTLKYGECRGTGTLQCNTAMDDLVCNITVPGATAETAEIACDNRDEDCNDMLDDNAPDQMVHVVGGGLDFWMDKYEASRPDADTATSGAAEHRPCSEDARLPWRSIKWQDASDACVAAGKRLCTEAEWQTACEGAGLRKYPYGNTYVDDACNGEDYDPDCLGEDDDICLPAGEPYGCPTPPATSACVSPYGVVDMSGNVKEWTATQVSVSPPAYRIRGGAYDTIKPGLTCQFDFVAGGAGYFFPNLGFRCCSDVAP